MMQRLNRFLALAGLLSLAIVGPSFAQSEGAKADKANGDSALPQVRRINDEIRQGGIDNKLAHSPPATDGEWCRRLYLDVLGRVPSVQELRDFLTSREPDKRAKLVNMLLEGDAYTEDYARNWATIWTNILIGRNGGLERRTLINREGMQK